MALSRHTVGNGGGPHQTTSGAVHVYDSDVDKLTINEFFILKPGVSTTLSAAVNKGAYVLPVNSVVGFLVTDNLDISDGNSEPTFPSITIIGASNFTLDQPLDYGYAAGDPVEVVERNMAQAGGSLAAPLSFKVMPERQESWHIRSILISITQSTAGDDSTFGDIAALTNGVVLRQYNAAADQFRTLTNWKKNGDIKADLGDLVYTSKAGPGVYGANGVGSFKDGAGSVVELATGDYLELLIQDDLSGLLSFNIKVQGHVIPPLSS